MTAEKKYNTLQHYSTSCQPMSDGRVVSISYSWYGIVNSAESSPFTDFNAQYVIRRGFAQECAFSGLEKIIFRPFCRKTAMLGTDSDGTSKIFARKSLYNGSFDVAPWSLYLHYNRQVAVAYSKNVVSNNNPYHQVTWYGARSCKSLFLYFF